jgi:N-methylhydantoinase A
MADLRHDYVRTYYGPLDDADFAALARIAGELRDEARARLDRARSPYAQIDLRHTIEVRYAGQDSTLTVPVDIPLLARGDRAAVHAAFNALHQRLYGYHDAGQPLEIVSVRLAAVGIRIHPPAFGDAAAEPRTPPAIRSPRADAVRRVWFDMPVECPIFQRDALECGSRIAGPAIVQEYASTTLVFPDDRLEVARTGELIIHLGAS